MRFVPSVFILLHDMHYAEQGEKTPVILLAKSTKIFLFFFSILSLALVKFSNSLTMPGSGALFRLTSTAVMAPLSRSQNRRRFQNRRFLFRNPNLEKRDGQIMKTTITPMLLTKPGFSIQFPA